MTGVYVDRCLSAGECDRAVKVFEAIKLEEGRLTGPSTGRRRSMAGFLFGPNPIYDLVNKILAALKQANQEAFHFDIDNFEAPQFSEYNVGDEYDWHMDLGPGTNAFRKLSASVQLSDPLNYDGGDLEFWNTKPHPQQRALGSIIVFPSYLPHRVTPVTHGFRRSLVIWGIGTKPFR